MSAFCQSVHLWNKPETKPTSKLDLAAEAHNNLLKLYININLDLDLLLNLWLFFMLTILIFIHYWVSYMIFLHRLGCLSDSGIVFSSFRVLLSSPAGRLLRVADRHSCSSRGCEHGIPYRDGRSLSAASLYLFLFWFFRVRSRSTVFWACKGSLIYWLRKRQVSV